MLVHLPKMVDLCTEIWVVMTAAVSYRLATNVVFSWECTKNLIFHWISVKVSRPRQYNPHMQCVGGDGNGAVWHKTTFGTTPYWLHQATLHSRSAVPRSRTWDGSKNCKRWSMSVFRKKGSVVQAMHLIWDKCSAIKSHWVDKKKTYTSNAFHDLKSHQSVWTPGCSDWTQKSAQGEEKGSQQHDALSAKSFKEHSEHLQIKCRDTFNSLIAESMLKWEPLRRLVMKVSGPENIALQRHCIYGNAFKNKRNLFAATPAKTCVQT